MQKKQTFSKSQVQLSSDKNQEIYRLAIESFCLKNVQLFEGKSWINFTTWKTDMLGTQ